jgi:hypothetical protein
MNTREYATFEDVQRLKGHIENSLKINNECQRAILAEEKQHLDDLIDNLQDRMEEDFKKQVEDRVELTSKESSERIH